MKRVFDRSTMALLLLAVLWGCAASGKKATESPKTTEAGQNSQDDERRSQAAYYLFMQGTSLAEEQDFEEASEVFEKALQYDPNSTEIRMSLGECYFSLHRFDRAVATVEQCRERNARIYEFLGRGYRFLGRDADAEREYRSLIALDSNDAESWWYLSRLSLRQGDLAKASDDLEHLARLRSDARVYNEIGDLRLRLNEYDKALAAYQESLREDSSLASRDAWMGIASANEAQGQYAEAAKAYRHVIAMTPNDLRARRRMVQMFLSANQQDSAIAVIQEMLAIRPDDPERLRLGILYYSTGQTERAESLFVALDGQVDPYVPLYYRGRIAADRNDYQQAKSLFRQAIASADSFPDAWIHLGDALLSQDSLRPAIQVAHQAIAATHDPRGFWYFIGLAFSRAQQYDSAVAWLDTLWRTDTLDSRVQFSLASSLERAGHFDQAADLFRRIIAREPNNDLALNYLGYMYADSGINLDESLSLIERALKQAPENGAYLDSHGWILYRLGRYQEAEAQIRKALEVMQADPTIHDHLGDILAALGRRDEAVVHWRRALDLEPDSATLRQKLGL